MNREIKFRIRKGNAWHYWDLTNSSGFARGLLELMAKDDHTFVINAPLSQFTGLRDKNGVDVYEGDILKYSELILSTNDRQRQIQGADAVQVDGVGLVFWDNEGADFSIELKDAVRGFMSRGEQEYEVIGNRYENPELLK